jgi:hypothetical protein
MIVIEFIVKTFYRIVTNSIGLRVTAALIRCFSLAVIH